ncbi:hypothetical protein PSECIP111951_03126 [Pseudoalteromonas holothuriae]|uniref:ABC3 transporter permease C-terminal domain-containing protein n=1 Tax=Pseudoalteromonas holothuriae TaxID=2963714 RepID=A0A9W4QUK1_9GAMM|nr:MULTISPECIES: FtsX-like permease family protein [unclassified Pseudoalteromonas]CAH9053922.1 hypothetical protein PSECIP111854_01265 [Pseudoalteromonas sp. CIP111854]CAH9064421.1 hypothetical protein PSECIP111951_03126 [Pseudoalteromonas sp. CIP111951]
MRISHPNQLLSICMLSLQQVYLHTKRGHNLLTVLSLSVLFFYFSFITLVAQGTHNYLTQNLQQLLGADTVIQTNRLIPEDDLTKLENLTSNVSIGQLYKLTLTHKNRHQFIQLKAVDDNYPLQGQLKYSQDTNLNGENIALPPKLSQIWLEPRLASALGIEIGETLTLGSTELLFCAYLIHEPDRLHEGHSSDMRALVHKASIEREHLKVSQHRYSFNHPDEVIDKIQNIQRNMSDSRLFSKALGRHPVSAIYQRVEKFLGLLSVLLIILVGIILLLASNKTSEPLSRFIAICMANGMNKKYRLPVITVNCLFILIVSFAPAFILALLSALYFEQFVQQHMLGFALIWQPIDLIKVLLLSSMVYIGLSAPIWFKVYQAQTMQLLCAHTPSKSQLVVSGLFLCFVMTCIVYWYSDNWTLTALLLGSLSVCIVGLLIISTLVLNLGRWGLGKHGKLIGFALYLMRKRIYIKTAQMMSLGLSITLVLMCTRIHQDVSSMLEHFKYTQQGNLLITQVDKQQQHSLEQFLKTHKGELKELYQYQYAQLTHINNVPLNDVDISVSDTLSTVQKPIRLHWNHATPHNNKLERGNWNKKVQSNALKSISIEDEVFNELNLKLGDTIQMQMLEQSEIFRVSSVHSFVPGSSNVTFWFVTHAANPIEGVPIYNIGSAQIPDDAWQALATLWQAHPSMRLHSIDTLLSQTRKYLNILTSAILTYSTLISLLTILLLIAAIQRHLQQDQKRNGLLISFGLSKNQQYKLALYEWLIIATLPTVSAFTCVYFTIDAFYQYELGLDYKPDHLTLLRHAASAVLVITLIGLMATKKQFADSVASLLLNK